MYKQLIVDWQEYIQQASFLQRDYLFPKDLLQLDKIISFVWARRVGKTTIMKQVLHDLVASHYISYQHIIRIDANEINSHTFNMNDVLRSYFELYPDLKPFIIIDEVHELSDWVRQVFVLYNRWYKIFLSGSNAHLLSSEISTKLRGKVYDQYIYALSRSEYKRFKNYKEDFSTRWQAMKHTLFEEYLSYGGFPEVVLSSDYTIKKWLLKNYFDVLLYKDLIERYNIDKEFVIKYLIKYLSTTMTKEFSVTNFINQLKSQSISITKQSIYNYLEYLQNIFFVYPVRQKHRQRWALKYYLNDIGYLTLRESEWIGKRFENSIINYYRQQWHTLHFDITIWWEVDIVVDDSNIQICRNLTAENIVRETKSLWQSKNIHKKLIYVHKEQWLILPDGIEYIQVFDVIP